MKNLFTLFAVLVLTTISTVQGQTSIWSIDSRAEVLKGDSQGVSIESNGTISIAPRLSRMFETGQPFVWSGVIDAGGNVYLGTGGDGRVFKITPAGTGSLFTDLAELNVSALAIGRNGELYAATSPDGKVYRIDAGGKADVYFEPKEKYIWSLAVMADGSLAVGTGESGKIYRVRAAGALPAAALMFDTSETHIISLAADQKGNLFAGTDPNGLVIRFGPDGRPFALIDSPLREIHEVSVGPDGSIYALAIAESVANAPTPSATPAGNSVSVDKPNPAQAEAPPKSRYDLSAAKSAVYRIYADGANDVIWSSPTVTGFSIYAHQTGNGVLIGTSEKGRIYSVRNDGSETLVSQSDAGQVSTIFSTGSNLYAASSNQGILFKIGPEPVAEGRYESPILDARSSASWGRIWWRSAGSVVLETRSGNTELPNETWSSWETVRTEGSSSRVPSPISRFLQWRATLKGATPRPTLNEVNVAFLGRNIAPEVLSITMLPPNVGLIANPPMQIDPNIELSGIDPAVFGIPVQQVPPRRAYQRGAAAFQWLAEDRNGDKLVYDIYFKEAADRDYKLLKANIADNFYSLDGQSLADGRYTIKIVARDSVTNPASLALSGERVSDAFTIDNTQPSVLVSGQPQVAGDLARIVFLASDRASYVSRAEYSIDGGTWLTVFPDDGIADGPDERFTVEVPIRPGNESAVTLRVYDSNGNAGTARATVRKP